MDSHAPSVHPQHALAVYAESLAAGARVAVFGDASLGLGARLVEQGAHAVHVWDPDPARARTESEGAPRSVSVRAYATQDADIRMVDLAIVTDLGLFADASALIARVRRMVGSDGVAIVAARSAEVARVQVPRAFDYYELFDLVAPEFQSVRMVAQLPFYGVAFVELGEQDESSDVNVDTQLGEAGRAPEAFVVVASQRGAHLDPYSIIQLWSPPREEDDATGKEELAQAHLRAALLTSQVQDLRAQVAGAERGVEVATALEESLRGRTTRAAELERALADRGRELAELSTEVEEMRAAAAAGRVAAVQVEELALRADRAERRAHSLEQELAKGSDAQSRELVRLEEVLRERAKAARLLEAEMLRREQMVRDLAGTLDELQGAGPSPDSAAEDEPVAGGADDRTTNESRALAEENARLRAQLDALALEVARREGDAQATGWQIAELGRQLAQLTQEREEKTDFAGHPAPQLSQTLDELEALRKALAQEHEARTRAESGEELARARAEIERQAVLMQQLVRELETRGSAESNEDSR